MKLSTSTNIMVYDQKRPHGISIEMAVKACAEAGYKEIDANLCGFCRPGQPLALDGWEKWAEETRDLADQLGVCFSQAHAYFPAGEYFRPKMTEAEIAWEEELMRRSVIAAELLGSKWMVVHPLTIGRQGWYDYKKSFAYNREYYKRWGHYFADHHVGMAIENLGTTTVYGCVAEELLELIDAIDNPMVEICIDTGHAHMAGNNVAEMIRQVDTHLKATHIADNHGKKDEHLAPFNGTIEWAEVMRALRDIHYEECFAFECHSLSKMYPKEVQPALVKFSYELGNYLLSL